MMTSIRDGIRRLTKQASPPFSCPVTVESLTRVSQTFVRVAVRGDGLSSYTDVLPADAFKVLLPPDATGPVAFPQRGDDGLPYWPDGMRRPQLRAFTVRHFDPDSLLLEFDIALHADGFATRWVASARPGDVIGLSGMRREFAAGAGIDRHLLVGDATALPGIARIADALTPGATATVYLTEVDRSDRELIPAKRGVTVYWVSDTSLSQVIRQRESAGGRVQAWLAAEATVVRELRALVRDELGVARDDLHAAAYWKSGRDSTQTDALLLEKYQREAQTGSDLTDPDLRERIEAAI